MHIYPYILDGKCTRGCLCAEKCNSAIFYRWSTKHAQTHTFADYYKNIYRDISGSVNARCNKD